MTWEERVKIFGKPIDNKVYHCKIQSFNSKKIIEQDLIWQAGSIDGTFLTADDKSELDEMNWNVIEWKKA